MKKKGKGGKGKGEKRLKNGLKRIFKAAPLPSRRRSSGKMLKVGRGDKWSKCIIYTPGILQTCKKNKSLKVKTTMYMTEVHYVVSTCNLYENERIMLTAKIYNQWALHADPSSHNLDFLSFSGLGEEIRTDDLRRLEHTPQSTYIIYIYKKKHFLFTIKPQLLEINDQLNNSFFLSNLTIELIMHKKRILYWIKYNLLIIHIYVNFKHNSLYIGAYYYHD